MKRLSYGHVLCFCSLRLVNSRFITSFFIILFIFTGFILSLRKWTVGNESNERRWIPGPRSFRPYTSSLRVPERDGNRTVEGHREEEGTVRVDLRVWQGQRERKEEPDRPVPSLFLRVSPRSSLRFRLRYATPVPTGCTQRRKESDVARRAVSFHPLCLPSCPLAPYGATPYGTLREQEWATGEWRDQEGNRRDGADFTGDRFPNLLFLIKSAPLRR